MSGIFVVGDIHMNFGALNAFISHKQPSIVLSVGDFGYWPRETSAKLYGRSHSKYSKELPKPKVPDTCKVYWCDGNHEDHQELGLRVTDELWPNVFYKPRGSLLDLPDGRRVMFFGGALSIDRESRQIGIDWFPQEVISDYDIRSLTYEGPVDIVISHTCPREFDIGVVGKEEGYFNDSSRTALSYILHHYRPKLWYFGHWHYYKTMYESKFNCRWKALDYPGHFGRWWDTID